MMPRIAKPHTVSFIFKHVDECGDGDFGQIPLEGAVINVLDGAGHLVVYLYKALDFAGTTLDMEWNTD